MWDKIVKYATEFANKTNIFEVRAQQLFALFWITEGVEPVKILALDEGSGKGWILLLYSYYL